MTYTEIENQKDAGSERANHGSDISSRVLGEQPGSVSGSSRDIATYKAHATDASTMLPHLTISDQATNSIPKQVDKALTVSSMLRAELEDKTGDTLENDISKFVDQLIPATDRLFPNAHIDTHFEDLLQAAISLGKIDDVLNQINAELEKRGSDLRLSGKASTEYVPPPIHEPKPGELDWFMNPQPRGTYNYHYSITEYSTKPYFKDGSTYQAELYNLAGKPD